MNPKIAKYLTNALKIIILAVIVVFLYRAIAYNDDFNEEFQGAIHQALQWENIGWLLIVFTFIPLNWSCEAWKWKILVSKMERVSFFDAFKGVLTGLTMSFISTTNAGAYFGRVWQLKHEKRYQILGGIIVNSLSQNAISYLLGGVGLIYFLTWKGVYKEEWFWPFQLAYILGALVFLYVLFKSGKLVRIFKRMPKVYQHLEIIQAYSFQENLSILGISALRYCTYSTQFLLVLLLFGIDLPLEQLLSGITLVYLAKSIVPNFSFLTDLGIREFTALQLMGENGYGVPDAVILSATLTLWVINILFPVGVGAIFTWQMRILSNQNKHESKEEGEQP